jgi:glycosyltransferase involved in cell wall biosynthesis
MLGDGELREKLLAHCKALGLQVIESAPWEDASSLKIQNSNSNIVYFPGFRQIEELPRFYAHAGAFVHASTTEQWGLVVNEAMASSLPVIVANRVGCAQDLVEEGCNGFTFDPYDVDQLAQLMLKISVYDFPLAAFGRESSRIIAGWGLERFASGLEASARMAKENGPGKLGIFDRFLIQRLIRR